MNDEDTFISLAFIKARMDRHFGWLVSDYPRVDEAVYQLQVDLEEEADRLSRREKKD